MLLESLTFELRGAKPTCRRSVPLERKVRDLHGLTPILIITGRTPQSHNGGGGTLRVENSFAKQALVLFDFGSKSTSMSSPLMVTFATSVNFSGLAPSRAKHIFMIPPMEGPTVGKNSPKKYSDAAFWDSISFAIATRSANVAATLIFAKPNSANNMNARRMMISNVKVRGCALFHSPSRLPC